MLNSIVADLLIALAVSVSLMFITWLASLKIKNAAIVDVVWAGGFSVLTLLYAAITDGWLTRKVFVAALIMTWSLRLSIHLLSRIRKEHPQEDARYVDMRKSFGSSANWKFLLFFEIQAIVLALLSLPICLALENENTSLSLFEYIGFGVFCLALVGETVADRQLSAFKKNPANKNEVCQLGLWRYSRHPNYFFEWLIWVGVFLIACNAEYGFAGCLSPLLMLFFLLKVSGVPLAEKQSLKSKGEKFRQYQKTTSVFFPWFRKQS